MSSAAAIQIRFQDRDWERLSRDWQAWWAGELERPLVVLETNDPLQADRSQLTRFGLEAPVDQVLDTWQGILEARHFHGDAYPKWWVNYGPGMMAGFLGSRVSWTPDTTWFWPLEGIASLADIRVSFKAANPWWQRVLGVTRLAAERWGNRVLVSTTDLGGNLDILASLRGSEKLLLDLSDDPENVDRLVGEITPLWLRCYDELTAITHRVGRGNACWGPLWSPGKGYMLQCDFSYMISPRMFARFVLPDLEACCARLDYAFYHLDGKGELPHLDHLLGIPRLRGIQWQPGDGQPLADRWPKVLQSIRRAGKLCQVYVNCEGARTIMRELGGKGFIFEIINESLTPAQADAFLKELQSI